MDEFNRVDGVSVEDHISVLINEALSLEKAAANPIWDEKVRDGFGNFAFYLRIRAIEVQAANDGYL